jgi:hypothetical protein
MNTSNIPGPDHSGHPPARTDRLAGYIHDLMASRYIFLIPIFLFILFYFPLLTGSSYFWEDILKYHYPNLVYTIDSLKQGEIPFWTPYTFAGMPHLADPQTAILYPPNWILFASQALLSPSTVIHAWFILGHILLLGFGIYKICLNMGMKRLSAVYASTAMMFSGFISLHVHHLNALYIICWFPLSFLYFKKYQEGRCLKHLGIASFLFGISVLAGYPQYTAFGILILLLYTLHMAWVRRHSGFRAMAATCLAFGLFLILSLGLALVQLLPTAELAFQSFRSSMSWIESVHGSLSVNQLITLLAPTFFGQVTGLGGSTYWFAPAPYLFWESTLFIGVIPLILLSLRLPYRDRRSAFFFFLTVGIFGLIMAMGKALPFYSLLYHLPGFNTFRIPGRFSFLFTFGIIMASAISLEDLQSRHFSGIHSLKRGFRSGIIFTAVMIVSLGLALLFIDIPESRKADSLFSVILALVFILIAWVLIARIGRSKTGSLPALYLVVLVFFELFLFGHRFAPGPLSARQFYPPRGILSNLKNRTQISPFRLQFLRHPNPLPGNPGILSDNLGNVYGLETINGYNPLRLARYDLFLNGVDVEKARQLLNVRYILRIAGSGIEKSTALPCCARFGLRSHLIPVENDREALDLLNDRSFDPHTQAVIESPPTIPINRDNAPRQLGSVKIRKYRPQRIVLDIEARHNSLLFASEIWYPGWRARLNDRDVPIIRTNFLFRGVEIPAGNHRLILFYRSNYFELGLGFSLVILTAIIFMIFLPAKNRDRIRIKKSGWSNP